MTISPRVAALATALALAASPALGQTQNEYYTVPAQIFPNGEPGRPDVMLMLTPSKLADDLDLTPVAAVPDKAKAEVTQVVFSGSGAPLLFLLHDVFAKSNQTQAGTFGPGASSAMFLTSAFPVPATGTMDMLQVNYDFDGEEYTEHIEVAFPVTHTAAKTFAVGNLQGVPDGADDVVIGHRSGLTLLLGLPGSPPSFIEAHHVPLTGAVVQDVIVADMDGDGRDDVLVATGDNAGTGSLLYYRVGTNDTLVLTDTIDTGAFASVHALDVDTDPELEVIAVEHRSTPPGVTADVLLFDDDGAGGFVATPSVLLTRASSIKILPRYGDVGDLDDDGIDDLVLTSNDTIVGTASTDATPPLFIDRLMNQGDGTFTVFTRFTRFAGRSVDPLVYDPTPITVPEPLYAAEGPAPVIVTVPFASNPGAGATAPQQQVTETFGHSFTVAADGRIVDEGAEIVHDASEPLDGVGDGWAGDLDGDGAVDLVMPLRDSDDVYVQYGDGAGLGSTSLRFDALIAAAPSTSDPTGPSDVWAGAIDTDGEHDIVVWSEFGHAGGRWTVHRETTNTRTYGAHQEITTTWPGEMVVADYDDSGRVDLVATQRGSTGSAPLLVVSLGTGSTFASTVTPIAADVGVIGRGGLATADLDRDSRLDFVTTYSADATADVSYANTWGLVAIEDDPSATDTRRYMPLGSTSVDDPGEIESIAIVETGRGMHRVAIGMRDGALRVVDVTASSHSSFTIPADAAETCGGHVGFADVDFDGVADLVSSTATPDGRSIVHLVVADTSGTALARVDELQGWSASLEDRGNRVVVADFDGDELDDLVLSHGLAGLVSLLPNGGLDAVEVDAGSLPNPPDLSVAGSSRAGSNLLIRCDDTPTTGDAYLFVGLDVQTSPGQPMYFDWFDMSNAFSVPIGAASGSFELEIPLPANADVGDVWSIQAYFTDGPTASDAVDVTILAEHLGQAVNPIE